MSIRGVRVAATIFWNMQDARTKLFTLAARCGLDTVEGQQDVLLARMLEDMNDAVRDRFCKIIEGSYLNDKRRTK